MIADAEKAWHEAYRAQTLADIHRVCAGH